MSGVSQPTDVRDRPSPLDALPPSPTRAPEREITTKGRAGAVALQARRDEQLRQEREAFDENQRQVQSWARLRQSMGWTALVALVILCAVSIYVLISHAEFPEGAIAAAAATVFVQTLALIAAVWRVVLGTGPQPLVPLTRAPDEG